MKKILAIIITLLFFGLVIFPSMGIQIENKTIIKTNPVNPSVITFIKTFGGTENESGNSIQQTTDNGYVITGVTKSFGAGNSDVWLIKTDKDRRPRDKSISSSPLLRFLERYPILSLLFQRLTRL